MKKRLIVMLTYFFVMTFGMIFGQAKLYAKEYYLADNSDKDIINEVFYYDQYYDIKYTYYRLLDEIEIKLVCSKKVYDEEGLEFAIYCSEEHFIDQPEHYYVQYKELNRKIQYNGNLVVTTVRFKAYI